MTIPMTAALPLALGVEMPILSASAVMHQLFQDTSRQFPDVFAGITIPNRPDAFNKEYDRLVTAFEIARASSPRRVDVARFVTDEIQKRFRFRSADGTVSSLEEAISRPAEPLRTSVLEYPYAQPGEGYRLSVPFEGRVYETEEELLALADRLEQTNIMQKEAADAFRWTVNHAFAEGRGGVIRLKGEKFALLGGDAELAPTRALLLAGAEVFTTHFGQRMIDRLVEEAGEFGGRLVYVPQGANLLTQTPEIAATIERFAGDQPVHLGAFAYAGGKGQEWRLGAAMEGIIRKVLRKTRSVTFYRTPSMVTEVSEEMARVADRGFQSRTVWQRFLHRVSGGRLFAPNIYSAFRILPETERRWFAQSVVPLQGPSYAGANLLHKVCAAEALQGHVTVSANVAPITATRSMDTPTMRAGFREAGNFGITIADPLFTRAVTFLLMVHDLYHPVAEALLRQQVHGGAYTSPFQLGGLLTYASVTGNLKRLIPFRQEPLPEIAEQASAASGPTTWVVPPSPAVFEEAIRQLKGDLAGAIAGAGGRKPARAMFLGEDNVVPKGGDRLFALVSWANRDLPWAAGLIRRVTRQKIYGSLLTTLLFKERGRDDQIVLTVEPTGVLTSVKLRRPNRQDLELRLKEGSRIEQVVHYGRELGDGSSRLSLEYAYDEAKGALRSLGPTRVNPDFGERLPIELPVSLAINRDLLGRFEELTGQPASGSVTLPPNTGFLRDLLKILPDLGVDLSRVTIQELRFERQGGLRAAVEADDLLDAKIDSITVSQTDKGELLKATLAVSKEGEAIHRTTVTLLIRGNHPVRPGAPLERVSDRRLTGLAGGRAVEVKLMGDRDLVSLASMNGDSNPLHQIDGVARVVGFRKKINPGFGTLAQIEGAIRNLLGGQNPESIRLSNMTGTLIRPGYPGETYRLEYAPVAGTQNHYRYQLVQAGRRRKVLVDGSFQIG